MCVVVGDRSTWKTDINLIAAFGVFQDGQSVQLRRCVTCVFAWIRCIPSQAMTFWCRKRIEVFDRKARCALYNV
jgi:hypothetical protein